MDVKRDKPLDDGSYRAILRSIDEKDTVYGERLMWLFWVEEHSAEVAGFTSLSPSTQANAYLWAVALNPAIASKKRWTSDEVIGRECILVVETVDSSKGKKNKIVKVKPINA